MLILKVLLIIAVISKVTPFILTPIQSKINHERGLQSAPSDTSTSAVAERPSVPSSNPSTGGPPSGIKPAGPPPPSLADRVFDVTFPILYTFSPLRSTNLESFKNLRVLWTRALLNARKEIDDPIAYRMLPRGTRKLVSRFPSKLIFRGPVRKKLSWIKDRTEFIDAAASKWMEGCSTPGQVVIIGAGYDTRAARFSPLNPNLKFFELDLPEVIETKAMLYAKTFRGEKSPSTLISHDLTSSSSIFDALPPSFSKELPTLFIIEAVMFYLPPPSINNLLSSVFSLPSPSQTIIVDNLAKVGVTPGGPPAQIKQKCKDLGTKYGKEMGEHKAIWGGAIHMAEFK